MDRSSHFESNARRLAFASVTPLLQPLAAEGRYLVALFPPLLRFGETAMLHQLDEAAGGVGARLERSAELTPRAPPKETPHGYFFRESLYRTGR